MNDSTARLVDDPKSSCYEVSDVMPDPISLPRHVVSRGHPASIPGFRLEFIPHSPVLARLAIKCQLSNDICLKNFKTNVLFNYCLGQGCGTGMTNLKYLIPRVIIA